MSHQTFWKPEKKVKEQKTYNSLGRSKKEKKDRPEWKKHILSHHQSNPSRADRAEFPREVIAELIKEAAGRCQCGCGLPDQETHHVMPRGRSGRGVKTNGMRLNSICHQRIQTNEEELQHWILVYRTRYGQHFWFDEQDWEEHNRKKAAEKAADEEKQQRMEQINPIVTLLSTAAGRNLKAKEIRLIDALNDRQMVVFAKLMSDVVGASIAGDDKPFGYGFFDD